MPLGPRRLGPTVARACAALLLLGVFAAGISAASDGDIWWHLASGREMVARRALLRTDPFSISAAGRPWPDVHWLFQLAVYGLHSVGGLRALVLAKSALLSVGAWWLLRATVSRCGERVVLPFASSLLLAMMAARELLLLRPVIPTLALLAYFFFALERARRDPRLSLLLPLPALQLVWSNLQGLAALGPALVITYALASLISWRFADRRWFFFASEARPSVSPATQTRALLIVALACCIAALVTPFGLSAIGLPATLLMRLLPATHNVFSANVAENVPPFAVESGGQFTHLSWYLGSLFLALCLPLRRLLLSQAITVAALVALALIANRNVLLLYWLATPIAVMNLAPLLRWASLRAPRFAPAAQFTGLVGFLAVTLLALTAAAREPSIAEPTPFRVPEGSVSRIAAAPDGEPIFAADHYGGYLIWKLYPQHRPYIDTRLVLRTAEQYREFLGVVAEPERFPAFASKHGFGYVVLPSAYPDRYLPLIGWLAASADWKLIYTDGTETLFARRDLAASPWQLGARETTLRILAQLDRRFASDRDVLSAARVQLATVQLAAGVLDEADYVLARTATREAEQLTARSRLLRGDFAAARAISERLLASKPDDVQSLNVLSTAALALGDPETAKRTLDRVFALDPSDSEAESILRRMEDERHGQTH